MDEMKAQSVCRKGIWMRVGLKNNNNHYGYMNSICIDAEHGFIRRFAVTPGNIHDSQMLPILLYPENQDDYGWADSVCSGERFKDLLSLTGFENRL